MLRPVEIVVPKTQTERVLVTKILSQWGSDPSPPGAGAARAGGERPVTAASFLSAPTDARPATSGDGRRPGGGTPHERAQVSAIHRRFFDESAGAEAFRLLSVRGGGGSGGGVSIGLTDWDEGRNGAGGDADPEGAPSCPSVPVTESNYLSFASMHALLRFVEQTRQLTFAPRSLVFDWKQQFGHMVCYILYLLSRGSPIFEYLV
jgi:hypothetical protein